jgi:hypothetical protein
MKIYKILLLLVITGMIFPVTSCKKSDGFNSSSATKGDFIGTWRGKLSAFKNNQTITLTGDIVFYYEPNGTTVSGLMSFDKSYVIVPFQFANGTYYFSVINSDTLNPDCQNWSLQGSIKLFAPDSASVSLAGRECGPFGEEWVNYTGTMGHYSNEPDPADYFSFAKTGNQWTYDVVLNSATSCQLNQSVTTNPGDYLFEGQVTNDCGWPFSTQSLKWYVSPIQYTVYSDSVANQVLYAFYLDARPATPYKFYPGQDTITLWLMEQKDEVIVPADTFTCMKFYIERRIHSNGSSLETGYFWVSNTAGIVRYQATTMGSSSSIQSQLLSSKNF